MHFFCQFYFTLLSDVVAPAPASCAAAAGSPFCTTIDIPSTSVPLLKYIYYNSQLSFCIAQAVQSLMKNRNEPVNTSTNIKFKFRMKFKSTMAAANTLKKAQLPRNSHYHHKYPKASSNPIVSTSSSMSNIHDDDFSQMRERRKSASKNAFCPPPGSSSTSSSSTASNLNNR